MKDHVNGFGPLDFYIRTSLIEGSYLKFTLSSSSHIFISLCKDCLN